MRRGLLIGLIVVAVLVVVGYFGVGYVVYSTLADVRGSCDSHMANMPENFVDLSEKKWPEQDYSAYFITDYETVRFPSREAGIEIAGWYAESDPGAPAVIVVDGLGGCKHALASLLPGGILYHNGFNVLLIDLRDTGESGAEDGYAAIGNDEYADALGAWDWLRWEKGYIPERIGLYGNSLGAATVMLAFMKEPGVAAVAVNSPFANLSQIMREELARSGYPTFLAPAAVVAARVVNGDRITEYSPLDAMAAAGDRPVFVTHSEDDNRIGIHHSRQLQEVAVENGVNATFWFVDGADHVQIPGWYTEEFTQRLTDFFHSALGR